MGRKCAFYMSFLSLSLSLSFFSLKSLVGSMSSHHSGSKYKLKSKLSHINYWRAWKSVRLDCTDDGFVINEMTRLSTSAEMWKRRDCDRNVCRGGGGRGRERVRESDRDRKRRKKTKQTESCRDKRSERDSNEKRRPKINKNQHGMRTQINSIIWSNLSHEQSFLATQMTIFFLSLRTLFVSIYHGDKFYLHLSIGNIMSHSIQAYLPHNNTTSTWATL